MIIKFKDDILPVQLRAYKRMAVDISQNIDGLLLLSYINGVPMTLKFMDAIDSPTGIHSVNVELIELNPSLIHDDLIDYTPETAQCNFFRMGNSNWDAYLRSIFPEYADLPEVAPSVLPNEFFFDFFGNPVETYILQYIESDSTNVHSISESADTMTPGEFFNTMLRDKYVQAYYLPSINKYFLLPFDDVAQNYEEDMKVDMSILPMYDMSTDKQTSEAKIRELYPSAYFASPETWEMYQEHIDLIESKHIAHYIWTRFSTKNDAANRSALTIDQLKNFRTWLATKLYDDYGEEHITDNGHEAPLLGEVLNSDVTDAMLKYYRDNMTDVVVRTFTKIGESGANMSDYTALINKYNIVPTTKLNNAKVSIVNPGTQTTMMVPGTMSSCGCNGNSLNVYNMGLGTCDCIAIYRKNVYSQMVHDFSDTTFWMIRKDILPEFRDYIEGIINNNFKLGTSDHSTVYCDCTCNSADGQQEKNMNILKNLLKSIEYMLNNDFNGHKNFISESLNKWAVILYEKMQWK